jgi:hypothetical protein
MFNAGAVVRVRLDRKATSAARANVGSGGIKRRHRQSRRGSASGQIPPITDAFADGELAPIPAIQMPERVPIKSTQRYQCEQLVCGR